MTKSNSTTNEGELEEKVIKGKYQDLISRSKEDLDKEATELNVEEGRQAIDSDILSTKREINKVKIRLNNAKSTVPLAPKDVISIKQELVGLQNGLKELEELKAELF